MQKRNTPKPWADAQLIIVSLAMALTLGLWNLFAAHDGAAKQTVTQQPPTQPESRSVSVNVPGGKLLLGGAAPQTTVFVDSPAPAASVSSPSINAPAPVTVTSSSK